MSLQDSSEQSDQDAGASSDDRYRLTHSSQIGTVLRDLAWQKCSVNVRARTAHEMVTTILQVDPNSRTFIFDWCRTEPERQALLASSENAFSASLRGVPVNFVIGAPTATEFEGAPAFVSPFPEKMYHLQRRRHFRARTLLTKGYSCSMRMSDGAQLKLDIADLSLSGVGLRSKTVDATRLPVGTTVSGAKLDFGSLGKVELNLQVVGHWLAGRDDSALHHFGCAFVNLDGRMENFLQRLVFSLELASRG